MYCLGSSGRRDGMGGRFKVTLSVAIGYFRLCRHRPVGVRRPARRLTWPGKACHPMDRSLLPDAVRHDGRAFAAGSPGGRQFPPGPGRRSTAGRPADVFAIELTGKVGKAARQALAGGRTATGHNGRATVCNGIASESLGPPVAHSPHFATGCPQGRSWISAAAVQRSTGSACCTSGGGEHAPPGGRPRRANKSRPGNHVTPR